jgi:hypothetical protein
MLATIPDPAPDRHPTDGYPTPYHQRHPQELKITDSAE